MPYTTYLLGRGENCDIDVTDPSVSRRHADVVVSASGALMIVDRLSKFGTWVDEGGGWTQITQYVARKDVRLRFGDVELGSVELLRSIRESEEASGRAEQRPAAAQPPGAALPGKGRVRRNTVTGVIETY